MPLSLLGQTSIDLELTKRVQNSIEINLLDNDFNSGNSATIIFGPSHGDLVSNGGGTFTYTPDGTEDTPYQELITYEVCHQNNSQDCQFVDFRILVEGDAGPEFFACEDYQNFPVYTNFNSPAPSYTMDVLANDVAENASSLSIVLAPIHGTVLLQNNQVIYTPPFGYQGIDEFLYTVDSADGTQSDQIKVTVVVGNTNDLIPVRDCAYLETKSTISVEEEFCYAIVVENVGPDTATGVEVYDQLPSEVDYENHSTSTGFYSLSNSTWTVGSLSSGEKEELEICVTANEPASFMNVAQVSAANQNDVDSNPNNDNGDQSEDDEDSAYTTIVPSNVALNLRAYLKGAYQNGSSLMTDHLRQENLIPLNNPYSNNSNFNHNGFEQTSQSVLNQQGINAVVDWVLVELRSKNNAAQILSTRAALIQRDGDIVDVDGFSAVLFDAPTDEYYVAVRHRNHLGVMTAQAVNLATTTMVDFTDPNQNTWGSHAQFVLNSNTMQMWSGNSDSDGKVVMQGGNNDNNPIFFEVLQAPTNSGNIANLIHQGYLSSDLNLDGEVIFQGANNDPNTVFFNVLSFPANTGLLANYIINEQLP